MDIYDTVGKFCYWLLNKAGGRTKLIKVFYQLYKWLNLDAEG